MSFGSKDIFFFNICIVLDINYVLYDYQFLTKYNIKFTIAILNYFNILTIFHY